MSCDDIYRIKFTVLHMDVELSNKGITYTFTVVKLNNYWYLILILHMIKEIQNMKHKDLQLQYYKKVRPVDTVFLTTARTRNKIKIDERRIRIAKFVVCCSISAFNIRMMHAI